MRRLHIRFVVAAVLMAAIVVASLWVLLTMTEIGRHGIPTLKMTSGSHAPELAGQGRPAHLGQA